MKGLKVITAASAAFVALAAAAPGVPTPSQKTAATTVQVLDTSIQGPNRASLPSAPANLTASQRSFLEKYQPLADKASQHIGTKDKDSFTASGHCYSEFPCFSVEKGAVATIGDKEEVTQAQAAHLLDQLLSHSEVSFTKASNSAVFSGIKLSDDGATLEIIAAPGTMPSDVVAGMAFDMFKMQSDNPVTNSIRATQARTDGQTQPSLALCLYPAGANATQAYNFCVGNELDGSTVGQPSTRVKRDGGLGFICSIIQLPILCE